MFGRRSSLLSPLLVFAGALAVGVSLAQSQVPGSAPPEPALPTATLRVGVTMVTVGVRVTDRRGREVRGLKGEDFTIFEDDIPQKLSFFSEEEQPISMAILLDHSGSMEEGDKLAHAKMAAIHLARSGHRENEFLFVPFDHRVEAGDEFTSERKKIEMAIIATGLGGGTSLYDATLTTLERFSKARHPRQALVVISDGADEHSLRNLADLIRGVQASQVQLFLIGYFSQREGTLFRRSPDTFVITDGVTSKMVDNPWVVFRRLAGETGAAAFFPQTDDELKGAAEAITEDLKHQYTIAYYPSGATPQEKYRSIQVKVRGRGLRVRARQGYRPTSIP